MLLKRSLLIFSLICLVCCKENIHTAQSNSNPMVKAHEETSIAMEESKLAQEQPIPLAELPDTAFVRLADYSEDFVYDMRYATSNNFLEEQVYDCGECYTRVATAKALLAVNKALMEKGYRIKFFDCYRPHDIQKKMWAIYPNPTYVADPAKGSIHNKGGAVDITLVDSEGKELDMGTGFDHFGEEAHHAYTELAAHVLKNRALLKEMMLAYGFNAITSEWWHYNYGPTLGYTVANFNWECN